MATVILLSQEELPPGESGLVQFRLTAPLAVKPFDRFVIRNVSPALTIGGGHFLHINPPKHRRLQENVIQGLEFLEKCTEAERIAFYLQESGAAGLSRQELVQLLSLNDTEIDPILKQLVKTGQIILYDLENNRYALGAAVKESTKSGAPISTEIPSEPTFEAGTFQGGIATATAGRAGSSTFQLSPARPGTVRSGLWLIKNSSAWPVTGWCWGRSRKNWPRSWNPCIKKAA